MSSAPARAPGSANVLEPLIEFAAIAVQHAEPVIRHRVLRIELNRLAIPLLAAGPVAIVLDLDVSHGRMRLRQSPVEVERTRRRRARFREGLLRRSTLRRRARRSNRPSRIGERVLRISLDRFFKVRDCTPQAGRRFLHPLIARRHVELVRIRIVSPTFGVGLGPEQFARQCLRDARRDGILHREYVFETLIELPGPPRPAIRCIEQPNRHAQAIAGSMNVSLEHALNAQLATCDQRILLDARVAAHGAQWRDGDSAGVAQLHDERIGHAELERRIALVRDERLERQHRKRVRRSRIGAQRQEREGGEQRQTRRERQSGPPANAAPAALGGCVGCIRIRRWRRLPCRQPPSAGSSATASTN